MAVGVLRRAMHRKVDRLPVDAALAGPHRLWSPQHFRSLCEDPAIWRLQLDYLLSKTKLSTLMQPRRIVWTTLILLLILPGLAGAQRRDATQVLIGQPAPKQVATLTDQLATVQSAMQAMADQLKRIGGQIETLQKQVDAFPKNPALSPQQTEIQSQLAARKAELDTTSQALAKAASELANADLDERRDLFDLVKEIFLIAGGIGGTGIAIFEVYYRLVIRKTRANLEQSIRSQILKETLITTGGTFARISIPWWSQCEPDFDAYLKSVYLRGGLPAGQAPFLSEIRLARSLTDQGFDFFTRCCGRRPSQRRPFGTWRRSTTSGSITARPNCSAQERRSLLPIRTLYSIGQSNVWGSRRIRKSAGSGTNCARPSLLRSSSSAMPGSTPPALGHSSCSEDVLSFKDCSQVEGRCRGDVSSVRQHHGYRKSMTKFFRSIRPRTRASMCSGWVQSLAPDLLRLGQRRLDRFHVSPGVCHDMLSAAVTATLVSAEPKAAYSSRNVQRQFVP